MHWVNSPKTCHKGEYLPFTCYQQRAVQREKEMGKKKNLAKSRAER
jgi:hypothetical protein